MSWEQALKRYENNHGEDNGFYYSRRENRGKRLHLLATLKEGSTHVFRIARYDCTEDAAVSRLRRILLICSRRVR